MFLQPLNNFCPLLQVASLVAVLKVARQLNLVRDLDRVTLPGHEPVQIPEALLQRAIEHGNEPLLVDAMALVCSHPKSTAVPGMAPACPYSQTPKAQAHCMAVVLLPGSRQPFAGACKLRGQPCVTCRPAQSDGQSLPLLWTSDGRPKDSFFVSLGRWERLSRPCWK